MNDCSQTKKILLISDSELVSDPRLLNQIESFKDLYCIHSLAIGEAKGVTKAFSISKLLRKYRLHYSWFKPVRKFITLLFFIEKIILKILRRHKYSSKYDFTYWRYINYRMLEKIKDERYDLIWANDIDVLPIAVSLRAESTKLVFDAHEYFLDEMRDENWKKTNYNYRKFLFKRSLPFIDKMITVSNSISKLFSDEFEIIPEIISNAKKFNDISPSITNKDIINLVHHGVALPGRNLETLISLMDFLDPRFYLHFYLKESSYDILKRLKKQSSQNPKIIFHSPVSIENIIHEINTFDIGIFLYENSCNNFDGALPNKFFEIIQARLMVICTPLKEVSQIIKEYNLGIIATGFDYNMLAKKLNSLTVSEINKYKQNCSSAAIDLCSEKNFEKMLTIANELVHQCAE